MLEKKGAEGSLRGGRPDNKLAETRLVVRKSHGPPVLVVSLSLLPKSGRAKRDI